MLYENKNSTWALLHASTTSGLVTPSPEQVVQLLEKIQGEIEAEGQVEAGPHGELLLRLADGHNFSKFGSFSAVSAPIFAVKYTFFSSRRQNKKSSRSERLKASKLRSVTP